MNKKVYFILLIALLFAIACIGCRSADETATRVADYYSGITEMTEQAVITAEFEDYTVDFELEFQYNAHEGSTVHVRKPAEIEDVRVLFDEEGVRLEYTGASLEVGIPEDIVIAPVAVLPELFRIWSSGIVYEQGSERIENTECLLMTYRSDHNETEILYRTWFDAETLKPVLAEVYRDGTRVIRAEFLIAENFR